jgi:hypothetical protein
MNAEQVFRICNLAALAGWVILVIAGRARWAAASVIGMILPLLLALVYTGLLIAHWGESQGGFGSIAAVSALFSNPWLLLAGWVHYLAFDLFIGSWEVRDAKINHIPHLAIVPCLILTFLFGPAGLLLYHIIKLVRVRSAAPRTEMA